MLDRPHSTPGRTGEEKITATARNRTPILCLSISHLLTTQTKLQTETTENIHCSIHIFRARKVNMWKVSNFASQFSVPSLPPPAPVYVTITSQKWWSHTLSTYRVQSRNSQTPRLPQQALTHVAPKSNQTAGADILTFMRLAVWTQAKTKTAVRRPCDHGELYPHRSVATSLGSGIWHNCAYGRSNYPERNSKLLSQQRRSKTRDCTI